MNSGTLSVLQQQHAAAAATAVVGDGTVVLFLGICGFAGPSLLSFAATGATASFEL